MTLNRKGEGGLKNIIIAFLLAATVVTGMVGFMTGVYENYGKTIEAPYADIYNAVNQSISANTETSMNVTQKIETSEGLTSSEISGLVGGSIFAALKLPFEVVKSATTIFTEVAIITGIPLWIVGVFITILGVTIIFLIISALRGKDV